MTTKADYLKREKELLELSNEGGTVSFNLDYLSGFKEGYYMGMYKVIRELEQIDKAVKFSKLQKDMIQLASEFEDEQSKKKLLDQLDSIKRYNISNELSEIYYNLIDKDIDREITASQALEIIEACKDIDYTQTLDNTIKSLKSDYGFYLDLGDEEDRIVCDDVSKEYEELKAIKINYIQKQVTDIYKTRDRMN